MADLFDIVAFGGGRGVFTAGGIAVELGGAEEDEAFGPENAL